MQFVKRGVALAMLTALSLVSLPSQAYQQDKTYKITILHTNDHHGHFWRSEYGEYGLAAQKTLVDGIRKEVAAEGGSVLLSPACASFDMFSDYEARGREFKRIVKDLEPKQA